jgi:hypothetical protein
VPVRRRPRGRLRGRYSRSPRPCSPPRRAGSSAGAAPRR